MYMCICVHTGMFQLRVSQNANFPGLWITKVPSDFLLTGCSHAILCYSEDASSHIFTAAHRLLFPVYTNL